jgi:hypothetical protein
MRSARPGSGSVRRWCSPRIARWAAHRPRSPGRRPRSRSCTPTRWCTMTSPAWTTTRCGAAVPPRMSPSMSPPRRAWGTCSCRSPERSWPAGGGALGRPRVGWPPRGRALRGRRHPRHGRWAMARPRGRGAAFDLPQLMAVHRGKTGALIRAAVVLGGIAGGASRRSSPRCRTYGEEIGLAFQVADDVLDATATSESWARPPAGRQARQEHLRGPARGGRGPSRGRRATGALRSWHCPAGRGPGGILGRPGAVYCPRTH